MHFNPHYLLLFAFLSFFGCSENSSEKGAASIMADSISSEAPEPQVDFAICLWNKVGLRDAPGRNAKYLETIQYGERVELLGESQELTEEKRNYIKVKLSDDQEGWVNDYLFAVNGTLGVANQLIEIYKRPDIMASSGKEFERGEIAVITRSDKEGWMEILGKEKKKTGWIQEGDNLSTEEIDVETVVRYQLAMAEESSEDKLKALEAISNTSKYDGSVFLDLVQTQINSLTNISEISENQLYITANTVNVRNLPTLEESEVLFQLNENDVCELLRKSDDQVEVNGNTDFWYEISFEGQTGWVFGHNTSKRVLAEEEAE